MTPTPTLIPADVRERVISAAMALFEQSGRMTMPTVDAVRRVARVDMNAASSVMKEWRRAQTAQATPVVVAVPEAVQQASSAAVAAIWQQAQELASESLRGAQAAWDAERGELDAMRQELAEAFELQAGELDAMGVSLTTEKTNSAQQAQVLADVRLHFADASSRVDKAEARIAEIEHRADDLRAELDRAHADADRMRVENAAERQQATAEIEAAHTATEAARAELVAMRSKVDVIEQVQVEHRKQVALEVARAAEGMATMRGERDDATKAAAEARERAAGLAGQLQALQEQNAALLAAITRNE